MTDQTTLFNEYDPTLDEVMDLTPASEPEVEEVKEPIVEEKQSNESVTKPNKPFYSPYSEVGDTKLSDTDVTQNIPNSFISNSDLKKCLKTCEEFINDKTVDDTVKQSVIELTNVIYRTSYALFAENQYDHFFTDEERNLNQVVMGDKGKALRIGYPVLKLDDEVDTLSGISALRYINKISKVGYTTSIPLWHSGLIVKIDPFSDQELLDLSINLSKQQIELGIETRGISLSGDDVFSNGVILDTILDHIVECNLKSYNRQVLQDTLLVNDIFTLYAGTLSSIYPSGYPIFHPCVNVEKGLCNYNVESKRKENGEFYPDSLLDFTKMVWVDEDKLTMEDKIHMSSLPKSHSLKDVQDYQKGLISRMSEDQKHFDIIKYDNGETIGIGFKIPTIKQYVTQSKEWVLHIKKMIDSSLSADLKLMDEDNDEISLKEKRTRLINSYSSVTEMVKHAAWVDYITITEPNGVRRRIVDTDSIKKALNSLVAQNDFKVNFINALKTFKEKSLIAFTGLPNFQCPSCGCGQVEPGSEHPSLIPINMVGYFFSTMEWRKLLKYQLG